MNPFYWLMAPLVFAPLPLIKEPPVDQMFIFWQKCFFAAREEFNKGLPSALCHITQPKPSLLTSWQTNFLPIRLKHAKNLKIPHVWQKNSFLEDQYYFFQRGTFQFRYRAVHKWQTNLSNVHWGTKTACAYLYQNNLEAFVAKMGCHGPILVGQLFCCKIFYFALPGSGLLCSICIRRKEKVHKSGLIEQAGPAQDGMDRKKENIIILLKFPLIL